MEIGSTSGRSVHATLQQVHPPPARRVDPRDTEAAPGRRSVPSDILELSLQARNRHDQKSAGPTETKSARETEPDGEQKEGAVKGDLELTEEEKSEVRELQRRDQEVRAHEQAHKAVGGQYAGAISYEYQTGPDEKKYAVGGEVPIDSSPASTPEETIRKGAQVRAAALAPAQPSGQDMAVAAKASQMIMEAQQEVAEQQRAELAGEHEPGAAGRDQAQPAQMQAYQTGTAAQETGRGSVLDLFG